MKFVLAALSASMLSLSAMMTGRSNIDRVGGWGGTTLDAADLFRHKCASCHGNDGRAKSFKGKLAGARNLTDATWQDSVTDERIFNSINNGKGKKMPAFGKKLSEAEVDALVSYVRGLKK